MPNRRARESHVRPSQPSGTGRRRPVRTPAPDPDRIHRSRGLDARRPKLPLPGRAVLAIAVVALGGIVFMTAGGGIGSLVSALGASFTGFFDDIAGTPAPSASSLIVADAPVIASPEQGHRNVIGAHAGSYAVYRALAIAAGHLSPVHIPDLTDTSPAERVGPHAQWMDPARIVSFDPWGHLVADAFADELAAGMDLRPSIAITKAWPLLVRPRPARSEIVST